VAVEDRIPSPGPRRDVPGSRRRDAALLLLPPLLACAVAVLVPPLTAAQTPVATEAPHVWLGPDGAPLPFESDEEVMEFLRTAEVLSRKTIEEGINREQKLLLESNGVRAHAIFRTVDREWQRRRWEGRYYQRYVDHYAGECAAYELARRLGLRLVPPAVLRRLGTTDGSVQIWVEGARDPTAPDFRLPSPMAWVRQEWDRVLFDLLILNADRNTGNFLVGPDYRLWLYDHGRAFQPKAELLEPGALDKVNRAVWDRLQSMSDEQLKDVAREFLDTEQLNALVERRALLAERVQALVNEKGEGAVFY
jgi:hypothetical protein